MSDKKHIDRLFQEKLKNFEATPDKAVWDKINSQLNQKKDDRKVIPIWWKLTGVAAGLILLLTVGNLVFNDSDSTTNVVETETVDSNNTKANQKNNAIVNGGENENLEENTDESSDKSILNNDEVIQPKTSNQKNSIVKSDAPETQKNSIKSKSNQTNYQNKKAKNTTNYLVNTQKQDVSNPNTSIEKPSSEIKNTLEKTSLNQDVKKEVLVENQTGESIITEKNISESVINKKEEQLVSVDENQLVIEKEKTPLTDDVIASNEDIIEEEKEIINRWQINPNIAPVYFNGFGKGSTIHEELVKNEKSGDINMSYGVNVSYAVNDKLSIKSGVNRVNLGYNTNDIIIYENVTGNNNNTDLFRNIKPKQNLPQLSFVSGNEFGFVQSPSIVPDETNSLLKQEMTFYEIPLEVKYKLSDKKLGFSLLGGFSTFILNDNKVSYELRGENTELGEASNINDISYSANIGFGLDYNLSKQINLNLDPMFKYQIKTFNNTSGDFKPYFIGIYSGINIKF